MRKYDVVFINMSVLSEWESGYENRNRHVVEQCLADARIGTVLLVDYPPYNPKRMARSFIERMMTKPFGEVLHRDAMSRLIRVTRSTVFNRDNVYQLSTTDFSLSDALFLRTLRRSMRTIGMDNPLCWSFVPFTANVIGRLGEQAFIFDAVDNWMEHPMYRAYRARLRDAYAAITKNASIIFTVSSDLVGLFQGARTIVHQPNGVDASRFAEPQGSVPDDIAPIPDPIAIYTGVIEQRFDAAVVDHAAAERSTTSFVLIGPVWENATIDRLNERANIHILGRKSYDLLPLYFREASVGIIPHRASTFTASMNPMKLYQYLAAGLPVVSTEVKDIGDLDRFVTVANGPQQFTDAIGKAVQNDNPAQRDERRHAASKHDWRNVVAGMLDEIEKSIVV